MQITTRLALDRLGSARARRESYVGPWLPEPLLTGGAGRRRPAGARAGRGRRARRQVSLALLVVLETLSPVERAVFVLREVFGMPAAEVAAALGRSEAAVRQMAHRAREHVQARPPRFDADRRAQREVTERFLAAVRAAATSRRCSPCWRPTSSWSATAAGKAKAALRPIVGADKVARFLLGVAAQGWRLPDLRVEVADVNGSPAIVGWSGTEPFTSMSLGGGRRPDRAGARGASTRTSCRSRRGAPGS